MWGKFQMLAASARFVLVPLLVLRAAGATTADSPVSKPLSSPAAAATPAKQIHVPQGFQVELLYSIPKDKEGSWVNLCVDAKGRLITSDQYGGLYRVTPPPVGRSGNALVEPIPAEIGQAQGMLWAFDSLYVVVNSEDRSKNGLYRVRDTDGDDKLDSVELLRLIDGDGEHGPHAVLAAPDGKSLYVVCGNATNAMEVASSRVPPIWDEDQLLPRIYGVGFMRGVPAPGGDDLQDRSRRQGVGAHIEWFPQPVRHCVQCRRRAVHVRLRTWNGTSARPGIAPPGSAMR